MSHKRPGSAELFPTDAPIPTGAMIGRARDVETVATSLLGGGNVVFAGPRRTGKTSVGDAAVALCAAEGAYTVTVDLFELADARGLAREIAWRTIANRPVLSQALDRFAEGAVTLRDALGATIAYRARQDLGDDLEVAISLDARATDPADRLRSALHLLERIAAADDRRLVVFLDEFQEITSGRFGGAEDVTRLLRAVLQRSAHVSVLFAGSVEHLMRGLFAPTERALSQFGSFHELSPITSADWIGGLRDRFARDRMTIGDSALQRLVEAGELHPRATMLTAQKAHQAAVEELEHDIDDALVLDGVRRALQADRLKHEQTLERIRAVSSRAELMAVRVARRAALYEGIDGKSASRALNGLRDAGLVEREGHGRWSVIDPLLRRYLAELPGQ